MSECNSPDSSGGARRAGCLLKDKAGCLLKSGKGEGFWSGQSNFSPLVETNGNELTAIVIATLLFASSISLPSALADGLKVKS